ncbi:LamG-like jellyroll fold domain-containing protein [Botryobacter ruber]|uniref:LamG-like jellyroll fold domain-containing protein n=1 Tax=Botryobacter ruber TaxID=2171629 RepID=UPI000E0C9EAA|nr:LamG-like jellyroll fold domain-containing protein [Botryobacter ruber]
MKSFYLLVSICLACWGCVFNVQARTISPYFPAGTTGHSSSLTGTSQNVFADLVRTPETLAAAEDGDDADMTQHIVNPGFESSFTGWTNSGMATQTNTSFGTFKQGNTYVEKWVSAPPLPNVSITQTVTGLPNGNYTLRVAAHNILQNPFSGKTGAFVFANNAQTEVGERNEYAVDFLVVDGTAVIGFKTEGSQGNWVAVDNFRLQYKGFDAEVFKATLQALTDAANALLSNKMQNPVRASLVNAIDAAEQALGNPNSGSELADMVAQLQSAIAETNASVAVYNNLQAAVDNAMAVYGDGSGNQAVVLLAVIQENQTLADNLDATLEELNNGLAEVNAAVFAFRLANATDAAPVVTTNTNFARGATMAFGRSTISVPVADLLEHGFCWSTDSEPTIFDNRTTKYFTKNGFIYHIENLQPATVYYMRAYAISKSYAVGYGDVLKVITIPRGTVTYQLNSSVTNSGEHYPRIAAAMESAVKYFNDLTSMQGHHLSVNYNAGTPTAEASYGGYMQFGANASYQRTGTALHEMGHTIGVGQHSMWYGPNSPLRATGSGGAWLGERANKVVQFLENNPSETMRGDGTHMWPYGINGAHEDTGSELLYIGNALVHQALGEDGLPPTRGFATPAYTFQHTEGAKYYIKTEDQAGGNTFLAENATGQLQNKSLSPAEALADESAAWYFSFDASSGYYQIRNAASGRYFTYQAGGVNGITLTAVAAPAQSQAFQLMGARYTTQIGEGASVFPVKAYWIVRPQATLTPPVLGANANGSTSAISLDFRDAATTQRWLLLSADDVNSFDQLLNRMPTGVENPRVASGDAKVTLTWDFMYGMKYDILRADSENGTYTTIATNIDAVRYVDANRENNSTYFYKIVAHNNAGRSPETSALAGTPKQGQHLYLSFSETTGTVAEDIWGGYHGSLATAASREAGKEGQGLKLTGAADSFVSLPAGVVNGLTNFSISTWVKMDGLADWMRVFDFGSGTSQYMFLTVQAGVTGTQSNVRYAIKNGGAEQLLSFPYNFPLNAWTHLVVTQSGSTVKLYINGTLVATNTAVTIRPTDLGATTQNYIGKAQYPDPLLRGSVDEFRIYNYALSEASISSLASGQPLSSGKDISTNVLVFPNPAATVINISGLDAKAYQYKVYNLVGSKVAEGTVQQGQVLLPAGIANGNYILQLTDNEKTDIRKHLVIRK